MIHLKKLQDNVTLITGGGQGIGYGLAQAFAEAGSHLVITGRTLSKLEKAKENLEKEYGVKVLPVVADGSKEENVRNVIAETIQTFGKLNTVINNAQTSASGVALVDHTVEDFDLAIYSGLSE